MVVPSSVSDHLLAESLGRPEAHRALGWLCDNVGGRTSGTPSGRRAEDWALELARGWGLDDVRFQELEVTAWVRGPLEVRATEPEAWRLTALAHGNCPSRATLTAPVRFVGHGEAGDYSVVADEIAGCLALCDEGGTEGERALHRTEKLALAVRHGAAGLLIESSAPGHLPRTGVCHARQAEIPSIGIAMEDGARLRRLLAGGHQPILSIEMDNEFSSGTARNVIADLRGSRRTDEVVLAGAHLDSWDIAEGATDNGLGSAIVLEMARALASLPERPRRTMRFVLWAAEEVGLLGSKAYVEAHSNDLADHAAIMNFDMTGAPTGFWTPGRPGPHELLDGLAKQLAPLGMSLPRTHRARLHSDHQPFLLAGVPVVGIESKLRADGLHYYHSHGDTYEKVSLRDLCLAAAAGAHTLWALADAPTRPFDHLGPAQVRSMVEDARLGEALRAEGYEVAPSA